MRVFIISFLFCISSAFAGWGDEFSTQINSNLFIGGVICKRPVEVDDINCRPGQWLVTVDTLNSCSENGACTEAHVPPFVAELKRVDVISATTYSYHLINPVSVVDAKVEEILKKYWVRFDLNGPAQVMKIK